TRADVVPLRSHTLDHRRLNRYPAAEIAAGGFNMKSGQRLASGVHVDQCLPAFGVLFRFEVRDRVLGLPVPLATFVIPELDAVDAKRSPLYGSSFHAFCFLAALQPAGQFQQLGLLVRSHVADGEAEMAKTVLRQGYLVIAD